MLTSEKNKRIAKNTLFLYFRMLVSIGVSLYTSRVVLNVLGVEDYGIYSVVGGVVAMFKMLNGSLASASQRFITFEIGKKENRNLSGVFSTTVTIHNVIAIIVLVVAESVGIWFLNSRMNIPPDRIIAANWVFQCSILVFVVNIVSVPYNASIIAHEHLKAFAYIGLVETVFKLIIALLLPVFLFDKLKVYAILMLIAAVLIRLIYGIYCRKHFQECKYKFKTDKQLLKRIAGFAGWNYIGASSAILMKQGVDILLNLFFGVIVNAAQGIATQVQTVLGGFVNNFMTALNPQITKSYASGEKKYMFKLLKQGARFSYYLMFLFSLPILIETKAVLELWLNIVPEYAVIFVRLSLLFTIAQTLSNTLIVAQLATGKIKKYQIIVGGLQMINFPLSYILLKLGFAPYITLVIAIVLSVICLIARLLLLAGMIGLSVKNYLKEVVANVFFVSIMSLLLPLWVYFIMEESFSRLFVICIVSVISITLSLFYIGITKNEKKIVYSVLNNFAQKLKR